MRMSMRALFVSNQTISANTFKMNLHRMYCTVHHRRNMEDQQQLTVQHVASSSTEFDNGTPGDLSLVEFGINFVSLL